MSNTKMVDIARMAGVSLATVGRVIHQNGYVSEDKRKEIELIIEETGYVPNKIAQGLKSSQSKLIGHMTVFNPNMLYEQISSSINKKAHENGYNVLTLTSHKEPEEDRKQVEELMGRQVDGVIITSNPFIPVSLIEKFVTAKIPVVMIERVQKLPGVDCIVVDDFNGAYEAVSHIIKMGHKNIGFIGMKNWHEVEKLRYQGYSKALENAGLKQHKSLTYFTQDYDVNQGKLAAQSLFNGEIVPTALFVTSDILACGVAQFCYEKGINIPKDLSLVGYDNTLSVLLAPPITSMGLPSEEIGEQALQLLARRMADFKLPSKSVLVRPILINRKTVQRVK